MADRVRAQRPIIAVSTSSPLLAAVGLTAVFAIGAWNSASLSHWLREWLKWVVISLVIWQLTLTKADHWRWLTFAVLLSATANALVGLYIFLGGSGADHLVILSRFYRAFGTFGQPNPFGGFMGIALPVALMTAGSSIPVIVDHWRKKRRVDHDRAIMLVLSAIACLVIAAALIASWSRGAWLGTAVALLAMFIALPRRLIHGVALAAAIVLLLFFVWWIGLVPDSIANRLTGSVTELVTISDVRGVAVYPWNYAVIERLAHWQAALNMAADSPLLGLGLGSYEVVYDDYRLVSWEEPLGHAHNYYLNLLAEAGIVGLVAYVGFWLLIIRSTWSLRQHPDRSARLAAIALLGCWMYIAVHSLFDNLYVNNLFLHIGVLLGVLAILQIQLNSTLDLE